MLQDLLESRAGIGTAAIVCGFMGAGFLFSTKSAGDLAADGRPATATVLDRTSHRSHNSRSASGKRRAHAFELQIDGVPGTHRSTVSANVWNATSEGDRLQVIYSPSNPDNVVVGSPEDIQRRAGSLEAAEPLALLALLASVGLGAVYVINPAKV